MIWKSRQRTLDLSSTAVVMGILNVTPDSFSDGGLHDQTDAALDHARRMISEGAGIIDVGGESTRPGADAIDVEEEIRRTLPVIRALRAEWNGWISIDTSKSSVAAAALEVGADVVNDVTGLRADPEMARICADDGCAVVVMHMRGEPRTMQVSPTYQDVVAEVREFFLERVASLTLHGIDSACICVDPGIGFGKTTQHNLSLLRALDLLAPAGMPQLLGVSRKSLIGHLLGNHDPSIREWPTVAITTWAREKGVMLHRVHSVRPNFDALRITEAILHS